jgi:hypothetical protein
MSNDDTRKESVPSTRTGLPSSRYMFKYENTINLSSIPFNANVENVHVIFLNTGDKCIV